jgi:hypothetical protein
MKATHTRSRGRWSTLTETYQPSENSPTESTQPTTGRRENGDSYGCKKSLKLGEPISYLVYSYVNLSAVPSNRINGFPVKKTPPAENHQRNYQFDLDFLHRSR